MAHGDLRFVSRVCHFLGFNNGHQAASSTFLFNQTISVVCGFVMFFFSSLSFFKRRKERLSVLECTCIHSMRLHTAGIRLYPLLSVMQETVYAGVACTNRQAESAAALNSIHWNACIKNGA